MGKGQRTVLYAAGVVLAAQVSLELFDSGFLISLGVVLLSWYVTAAGEYPALRVSALAGAGCFALRTLLAWMDTGTLASGGYWPEMVFYLVYGLLFSLYFQRLGWTVERWVQWLPLAAADYAANLIELLCRGHGFLEVRMHLSLLAVAGLRTALAWGFWQALRQQSLVLLRREHARRYRRLTLLVSRLRGEILWLQKSAATIESTMGTAYGLYARLREENSPAAPQALSISKDVHEIKKEYQLIVRGLSQALEEDLDRDEAGFRELWQLLCDDIRAAARQAGVDVTWEVDIPLDFRTDKQYQLLSILRNLLDNAVEAARDGRVTIAFSLARVGDNFVFTVANTGNPIPPDRLPRIFTPGFSTKINYATGQVGRGVGLCLVRDLAEELGGGVSVDAQLDRTVFTVTIPAAALEVTP